MPDQPTTTDTDAEAASDAATAGAGSAQARAWAALAGHRWWAYRACAPHPDAPAMAASDPAVPLTVWLTADTETQPARYAREAAALALCGRCPLREACLAYALGDEAGPYERRDIWGGMLPRERAHLLRRRRITAAQAAVTVSAVRATTGGARDAVGGGPAAPAAAAEAGSQPRPTARDLAVLQALASHRTPAAVATATGLTVTRANWHRARLVTALGLDPYTTTRDRLLHAARLAGLLDPRTPIRADRGLVAAVPSRQAAVARSRGIQLPLPGMTLHATIPAVSAPPAPLAGPARPAAAAGRPVLAVAA